MKYVIISQVTNTWLYLHRQVHHILADIIQGGLVLETNVEEIDSSGSLLSFQGVSRP